MLLGLGLLGAIALTSLLRELLGEKQFLLAAFALAGLVLDGTFIALLVAVLANAR